MATDCLLIRGRKHRAKGGAYFVLGVGEEQETLQTKRKRRNRATKKISTKGPLSFTRHPYPDYVMRMHDRDQKPLRAIITNLSRNPRRTTREHGKETPQKNRKRKEGKGVASHCKGEHLFF